MVMDPLLLLQDLVRLPGPPGQEGAVRDFLVERVHGLGLTSETDPKGNLHVRLGNSEKPKTVITAHMDEIAMIVRRIEHDGTLAVGPLGGMIPWKLGEGPVTVMADGGCVSGVFSFGSVHSSDPSSPARRGEVAPITWEMGRVFLAQPTPGIRPGTRVVIHPSRRELLSLDPYVGGHFLDDRADLVAWLLALEDLRNSNADALFVATVSEEVGGEGALYALHHLQPEVCIALELGPAVWDAPVILNDQPTVWASDSFATMTAADGQMLESLGKELGMRLQFQALTRGGSDASGAAAQGLCARPITLGIPMLNSHGFEIIHPGAMKQLSTLTSALVRRLTP